MLRKGKCRVQVKWEFISVREKRLGIDAVRGLYGEIVALVLLYGSETPTRKTVRMNFLKKRLMWYGLRWQSAHMISNHILIIDGASGVKIVWQSELTNKRLRGTARS